MAASAKARILRAIAEHKKVRQLTRDLKPKGYRQQSPLMIAQDNIIIGAMEQGEKMGIRNAVVARQLIESRILPKSTTAKSIETRYQRVKGRAKR